MLSLKEIVLLNLIIDDTDFFALPSIQNIKITPLIAESIYASLISKEILLSRNSLTEKGTTLVQCMSEYKSASKYVKIGFMVIGLYKEDYGIAVVYNPFKNAYSFKRIKIALNKDEISKSYPFLLKQNTGMFEDIPMKSYQELQKNGLLKLDNSIVISTFDRSIAKTDLEKAVNNNVLFYHKGNHYRFDSNSNTCSNSNFEDSIRVLKESMVI